MSTEKQIAESIEKLILIPLVESMQFNHKVLSESDSGCIKEITITLTYHELNEA